MILFKSPEQLLEARHAVESVESDTVALKTLMFEIFWDAEVLGTFRALSKPSPPKHQVTLEQHRFASTLKWRYDDVICVDCKAWTRQSMPWSQDLKYTAIPVKLTFCWVLLFPYMFLVFFCCLRWKKNRQLKYPLMSSALRFRVIGYFNSTQKSPTGQGQTIHFGTHWWRVASSVRVEL